MAETKWTPGPWSVENTATCGIRVVHGPADPGTGFHDDVDFGRGLIGPSDEQRANMHLIASAPDLYDALNALVTECESLYKSGRLDASVWLQARAALAKARGEQ